MSYIGCWRAMGILAMSRAIGDLFLKPYVSAEPEVSTIMLETKDEFFVLASDGIFDVFDNDQVLLLRRDSWRAEGSPMNAVIFLVCQVVRIVRSAHTPHEAATLLTNSAFVAGAQLFLPL